LLAATIVGLTVALWIFRSIGLGGVAEAARRIGWGGAILYYLYSLLVFGLLGGAWLTAAPGEPPRRILAFTWARLTREAVADLLPFSQIGGIIVGTRTLIAHGIAKPRVYASMIADMTTEMASQLLFTFFGLAAMASLLLGKHGAALRPAVLGATAALIAIMALVVFGQRPLLTLASKLARRVLPAAAIGLGAVDVELRRIYAHRRHIALSFLFNLAGWAGSAAGAWILLRLIGVPLPLLWVLAIESLIFTVRSVAFAVPGAIGFQEAAYVLVGPLFGLPPETALALSLAKRARDVAIGLPALLAWQALEARAMLARG
jgi:putative membrane protein